MTASRLLPQQALEIQDELIDWWTSEPGISMMDGIFKRRKADDCVTLGNTLQDRVHWEVGTLHMADTYYVSAEMAELALHAARSMPEQSLLESDLPNPYGFMVLERPIISYDKHARPISVAAFLWAAGPLLIHAENGCTVNGVSDPDRREFHTKAVGLAMYSDNTDPRDWYVNQFRTEHPNLSPPTRFTVMAEAVLPFKAAYEGQYELNEVKFNRDHLAAKHDCADSLIQESEVVMRRFPMALWALMQQKLAMVTVGRAERHTRRRLERKGSQIADHDIRFVTLRKRAVRTEPEADGDPVEWTHRWMVSGHWRNVWHATLKVHRLQWIFPFVKGPDDKPLVLKRTVQRLVR